MSIAHYQGVGRKVGINVERKHETPDEALGAVITALRLERNWSHAELSHRVGYTEKHMIAVQLGTSSPTHGAIVATAQAFGLRGSQLLARAERLYLNHRKKAVASHAAKKIVREKPRSS